MNFKSQTLSAQSSPPLTNRGSIVFHDITFTSESWAFSTVQMQAFCGATRQSHNLIVLSEEHEANT